MKTTNADTLSPAGTDRAAATTRRGQGGRAPMTTAATTFINDIARALSRHQRTVVMLRYTEALSIEEIAAVMRSPASAVEETLVTVRRIVSRLRAPLAPSAA